MKLTRTDVVFSRTTMVLFLYRNKSSRIGRKFCEDFLYNKRELLVPRAIGGGHLGGHNSSGRQPSQVRPGGLSPPSGPADSNSDTIKSHIWRKNRGERIIAFHEAEPLPPPVLHRETRSGVRLGLWRGESSFFVITNRSPSPIP